MTYIRPPFPEVIDSTIIASFRSCPRDALSAEAEEIHQVVLRHAVVGWGGRRLVPDDHFHTGVAEFREGVDDEDAICPPGVDGTELLPSAVVGEVGAGGENLVECVVLGAAAILHLREGFVGEFPHVVCAGDEGVERECLRHGDVPVEVGRDFLPVVTPVSEEGFKPVLGEEAEDRGGGGLGGCPVNESPERVGLAYAGRTFEEDLWPHEGSGLGGGCGGISHSGLLSSFLVLQGIRGLKGLYCSARVTGQLRRSRRHA